MSHLYQSILDENSDFVSFDDDLTDVFETAHHVLDRMYDELMSMDAIAQKLGCSKKLVLNYLKEHEKQRLGLILNAPKDPPFSESNPSGNVV